MPSRAPGARRRSCPDPAFGPHKSERHTHGAYTFLKVKEAVLACFLPLPGQDVLAKARDKLRKLRSSPRVIAAPTILQDEVQAIASIIANCVDFRPPQDKEIERMSALAKSALKRAEDSYVYTYRPEIPDETNTAKMFKVTLGPETQAVGQKGVHLLFDHIAKDFEAGNKVELKTLKPLRQFRWTLPELHKTQVQKWIQAITGSAGKASMQALILKDAAEPTADCTDLVALASADHSASSASSSAGAVAPVEPVSKKAKQGKAKADKHTEALLAFFTKKPKDVGAKA